MRPRHGKEVTDVRATGVQNSEGTVKEVVLGVDTHLDAHVAVALDGLGRHLGESKIPTTLRGYGQLLRWAQGLGVVRCAGVEGTGSYGAGLAT
jgi:transposase